MLRKIAPILCVVLILAGCSDSDKSGSCGTLTLPRCGNQSENAENTSNRADSRIYRIKPGDVDKLQTRMQDSINALRSGRELPEVVLSPSLNVAASTHARDMSIQNRPWHFGSDGSSPIDRLHRSGYIGALVGENIAETYETEIETLAAWMEQPDTRATILAPQARDLGFSWFQERNGKIWWVLIMGDPDQLALLPEANPVASRLVPHEPTDIASAITDTDTDIDSTTASAASQDAQSAPELAQEDTVSKEAIITDEDASDTQPAEDIIKDAPPEDDLA